MSRRFLARAAVTITSVGAALVISTSVANAYVTYTDDDCSSSTRCFAIFYNSLQSIGIFHSPCFITNKSEYSHLGYDQLTASGMQQVRFQFNYDHGFIYLPNGSSCIGVDPGSGYSVKNDAAGAANSDSHSHRVFYNTGYAGAYQTFEPGDYKNLAPVLKNNNASSERL